MSYEMLVALNVIDHQEYQKYREAMKPILSTFGGSFGYDFRVSEVLISDGNTEINRVFTINFPDARKMDAFFSNPEYLKIKQKYFENSVGSTKIISSYEKNI